MKTLSIPLLLLALIIDGCSSYSVIDGSEKIKAIEDASNNPGTIANQLIPIAEKTCGKRSESWDYYWSCMYFNQAIGNALFASGRYSEANNYIIDYLLMQRTSQERNDAEGARDLIQCKATIGYTGESKKNSESYNARTALYTSLKASGDPKARDYLALAYLCQSAVFSSNLPPVISDATFLNDVERLWGLEDRREAEFYIKNVKQVIDSKRDAIIGSRKLEEGEYYAMNAVIYKNAYEYVKQNNMSLPYQQFLEQQYKDLTN